MASASNDGSTTIAQAGASVATACSRMSDRPHLITHVEESPCHEKNQTKERQSDQQEHAEHQEGAAATAPIVPCRWCGGRTAVPPPRRWKGTRAIHGGVDVVVKGVDFRARLRF
jgi:hypothetical protein